MTEASWRRWVWPGIFQVRLPTSWSHRDVDGLLEFSPENGVGALHIRVLDRSRPGEAKQDEAAELVSSFAENQGVSVSPRLEGNGTRGAQASANFISSRGQAPLYWDVYAHVWSSMASLARMFTTASMLVSDPKHKKFL